jgi:hypothetical protein
MLLLSVPLVAALSFLIALIFQLTTKSDASYRQALWLAGIAYSSSLAAVLFLERDQLWLRTADRERPVEIFLALIGSVVTFAFIWRFTWTRAWADLQYGFFSALACLPYLVPRRTDRVRSVAFMLMSAVTFHQPLISLRPPFISLSLIFAVTAVFCLLHSRENSKWPHSPLK